MQCAKCLYNGGCSLQAIARDITGCEGHSKEKPPKANEVRCSYCGEWIHKDRVFTHKDGKHYCCFKCF